MLFNDTNHVYSGDTIIVTNYGLQGSYSDSQFFNNSARGYESNWHTFMNHNVTDVTDSVIGETNIAPGATA